MTKSLEKLGFALFLGALLVGCGPKGTSNVAGTGASGEPVPPVAALFLVDTTYSPAECLAAFEGADDGNGWDCVNEKEGPEGGYPIAIPLGCYNPLTSEWSGQCELNDALLSLEGKPVTFEGSFPAVCGASGDVKRSYGATYAADDHSGYVITQTYHDTLSLVPAARAELAPALLEAVKADGVQRAVASQAARDPENLGPPFDATLSNLTVDQIVELDVDGDGVKDLLVSVSAPLEDDVYLAFSGLYLIVNGDPARLTLLMKSDLEKFTVLALTDLDRNHRPEIVLASDYYEGSYIFLYRFAGTDLVQIAGWGCGA